MAFLRFLRTAAARTAQILQFCRFGARWDVAPNTAKAWLRFFKLQALFICLSLAQQSHQAPVKTAISILWIPVFALT